MVCFWGPEGPVVIGGGPAALLYRWYGPRWVWNRRTPNKECRMLKGDTSPLPEKDARSSRRQLETYPDIAARFLQNSKFLARYSSAPAAGKYRKSRTHWT